MQHRNGAVSMITAALFIVVATLPVIATADDHPWKARISLVSMDPSSGQITVPGATEFYSFTSSDGVGLAIDFEYRATKRLGIDLGLITAAPSIGVEVSAAPLSVSARADIRITPIYVAANFHPLTEGRFDPYVGGVVAYVVYHSFELVAGPEVRESLRAGDGLGLGAVLGLDIGLGDGRWSLTTAVRYIDTALDASPSSGGPGAADMNPTIFSLGFGYEF